MPLPVLLEQLHERARATQSRIVLPETADPRMQDARGRLENDGLTEVVWIPEPESDPRFDEVVNYLFNRRKDKGITEAKAQKLAADPLFFADSLVALGHADGCVAGSVATTGDVIRAGLQCVGPAAGVATISSFFLMVREAEVLTFADCAVVPDPDSNQLVDIAAATAQNHKLLTGLDARMAFLSFSTHGSARHERVTKIREAHETFAQRYPDIAADGEIQFDTAYVEEIAQRKAPDSPVAGRTNVFVFPDLDAGNIAYKIAERLGGFQAIGPVLQGLAKPCLDLSRGCSVDDIVNVSVIAAIMSSS